MKNIIKFLVFIVTISFVSCEDVVEIDLETSAPKLVIDANINWEKTTTGVTQEIKLSLTSGFYENTQPPASGATVTITNSSNVNFIFTEVAQSGIYKCTNFQPVINEIYTLNINYKGENYTATDKLYATPEVVNVAQEVVTGVPNDIYRVTFFYLDNVSEVNYYLNQSKADIDLLPRYFASRDEFLNGNLMFGIYGGNEDVKVGTKIDFTLYGISQPYYNYMRLLISQSGVGGGNPFAAPPATVRGNIVNTTNPSNFPLGYFRLSEISKKSYTIQ
jgi:Domain of unknown function (DUF4249)